MTPHPPLHQLNPLTRFDDRANDYARFRPSYPTVVIDTLLGGLGDPAKLIALDAGAGTGISSRLLADRGLRVWAAEPNAAMRAAAEPHPGVTYIDATAEHTGLPDASVDLVTSFQAFHWFEPTSTLREFQRLLRLGGRLALVWNERDARDAFTAEYGIAILEAAGDHPALKRSGVELSEQYLGTSALFCNARIVKHPNSKRMAREALLGASLSGSYIPRSGPMHDRLMRELGRLHEKYAGADGCVEMIYQTEMLLAERS